MILALMLAAALTADFGAETGKMRPALYSSGFKDGKLRLTKPDFHSAAFLVEFK